MGDQSRHGQPPFRDSRPEWQAPVLRRRAAQGLALFALDRIVGKPARSGTFVPRPIPPAFLTCDAVGMVRGGSLGEVTVRLSPAVAASIVSRRWQRAQRVVTRPDGSAEITFTVGDVDEVVRWSLGLGAEAVIVAPEAAISAARRLVQRLVNFLYRRQARTGRTVVLVGVERIELELLLVAEGFELVFLSQFDDQIVGLFLGVRAGEAARHDHPRAVGFLQRIGFIGIGLDSPGIEKSAPGRRGGAAAMRPRPGRFLRSEV